jgi:hypothetical protein
MTVQEGTPWQPMQLDEFLDAPFERLQEQQSEYFLERMNLMLLRLGRIERDLEELLASDRAYDRDYGASGGDPAVSGGDYGASDRLPP